VCSQYSHPSPESITPDELLESHECYSEFSDEFELLYIQRRADHIHFVHPVIHILSHVPADTVRKGPRALHGQWLLERTIGNLGEELRQHSTPYTNISQCAIGRCQVNALKSIIPDFEPPEKIPHNSVDLGSGYFLLGATDNCRCAVCPVEATAIQEYLEDKFGPDIAEEWQPSVVQRACAKIPNSQIACSLWKEHTKLCSKLLIMSR
jgi:hypothetical protein